VRVTIIATRRIKSFSNTEVIKLNEPRFDWLPILKADFISELSFIALGHFDTSPKKGVNTAAKKEAVSKIASHIISSLYQVTVIPNKSKAVSIPLSNSSFDKSNINGEKVSYSKDYTRDVFNVMLQLGWIEAVKGTEQSKKYTRISACGLLLSKFKEIGLIWFEQQKIADYKTVLLRDVVRDAGGKVIRDKKTRKTSKYFVATPKSGEVDRMKVNLNKINSFLAKQCITIDLDDEQLSSLMNELNSSNQSVSLFNVQLVRIFSRGSMDKGGRFYRGWWQTIPSKYRPLIRINDKKTVEIDYSSIGLRILYAKVGKELPVERDLYDIGLNNWIPFKDERRPIVKKVFNTLINDEDSVFLLNEKLLGISLEEFLNRVELHHEPIYHLLRTEAGLQSQKVDSDVAEQVMLELIDEGIPVLPIHDSFIVPAGFDIEPLMNQVFKSICGHGITCEKEVVMNREQFGLDKQEVLEIEMNPDSGVVRGGDIKHLILDTKSSAMSRYLNSYLSVTHSVASN
jgi:bifunctional DNA-binding transcriptional regulator/antitoxin component of YhaV-PrlF toxin-antitoxin module